MLIILIILICMYFILKDILSGKKKIIWHEEKHIEIDYDIETDQETDDITNVIIFSSIIDSSVHSMPDCSSMNSHSCDCHSVDSHNCH